MRAWWSGRRHGDQRAVGDGRPPPPPVPGELAVRRLTQEHGSGIRFVGDPPPGSAPAGILTPWSTAPDGLPPTGDALVAATPGVALAVLTADCAAVALGSPEGVFAAVHAGWRGAMAGVVQQAVAALRGSGATEVVAALGPCINPCCYEFSPADLDRVSARYGPAVRADTRHGRPALDLPAAVDAALADAGVAAAERHGSCTACGPDAFSFRRARDEARQALFVWRQP